MIGPASKADAPSAALTRLTSVIRQRFGLDFDGQRFPLLVEALQDHGRDATHAAQVMLADGPARLASFVEHLANGETYFLRHPTQLEAIRRFYLELAHPGRGNGAPTQASPARLRAWCAGCSSGEEALSLAMTLMEIPRYRESGALRILATDLSGAALVQARAARYGSWSFRGVSPAMRDRYFQERDGRAIPLPSLQAPILYEQHNLLRGPPPAAPFDLLLCRNVLIYFDPASLETAFGVFREALRPGGLLVVGPAEGAARVPAGFAAVEVGGVILYRKEGGPRARTKPRSIQTAATPPNNKPMRLGPPSPPTRRRPTAESRPVAAAPPLLQRAQALADQGAYVDARDLLHTLLGEDPAQLQAQVILILVELESGELEEAACLLDALLKADPESLMGHYLMGHLFQALGQREAAQVWYQKSLALLERATSSHDHARQSEQPEQALLYTAGLSLTDLWQLLRSLGAEDPPLRQTPGQKPGQRPGG